MKKLLLNLFLLGAFTYTNAQQISTPAPSTKQSVTQQFATSYIGIEYSRPSVKDRKIFGDLVPFGTMWRTGANATTKISFGEDVTLNGNNVKAGKYVLLTIPNKDEWEIIISKDSTMASTGAYKQENDLVRFKVKTSVLKDLKETFTISVENITDNSANLVLAWENTELSMDIKADYDAKVTAQIEKIMSEDNKPYFQAATYFYNNNKDLNKALAWSNKAIEQNPAFYIIHLKAKILLKQGKKKEAIAVAEQSKAKAMEAKNDDYVKMNDKLISEAK